MTTSEHTNSDCPNGFTPTERKLVNLLSLHRGDYGEEILYLTLKNGTNRAEGQRRYYDSERTEGVSIRSSKEKRT